MKILANKVKDCPYCGNEVGEEEEICNNCGKDITKKRWEDKIDSVIRLTDDFEEDVEIPSLQKIVENRLSSTLKSVEEDIRESIKKDFQTREKKIKDRYEREKLELREELNELREELLKVREESEKRREELRKKYEQEKQELRERLEEEKDEIRYRLERDKIQQKDRFEERIQELKKELERERKTKDKDERIPEKERSKEFNAFDLKALKTIDSQSELIKKRLEEPIFPFPALVDQEKVKRALLLNVINPKINGVMIWGGEGVGKSTALVGMAELVAGIEETQSKKEENIRVWNDEERYVTGRLFCRSKCLQLLIDKVLGNISITIDNGEKGKSPDIANSNLEYSIHSDEYVLSYIEDVDLAVKVENILDIDKREKIVYRREAYKNDPKSFYMDFEDEIYDLRNRVVKTRQKLPDVEIPREKLKAISKMGKDNSLSPGKIMKIKEIAKTIAAYDYRTEVEKEDLETAKDVFLDSNIKADLFGQQV